MLLRPFSPRDIPALTENGYGECTDEELREIIDGWNEHTYGGRYFEMFAVDCGGEA